MSDKVPCEAVPAVARFGHRNGPDARCASQTPFGNVIVYGGVEHAVCGMHLKAWRLSVSRGVQEDLARRWGW